MKGVIYLATSLQLNDIAVQHREVQGHESALFRSYFSRIILWKGGYVLLFCSLPWMCSQWTVVGH